MKSSSVSKGKLKLKDFIDSSSRCGCKLVHRIPDPSILSKSIHHTHTQKKKSINGLPSFSFLFSRNYKKKKEKNPPACFISNNPTIPPQSSPSLSSDTIPAGTYTHSSIYLKRMPLSFNFFFFLRCTAVACVVVCDISHRMGARRRRKKERKKKKTNRSNIYKYRAGVGRECQDSDFVIAEK